MTSSSTDITNNHTTTRLSSMLSLVSDLQSLRDINKKLPNELLDLIFENINIESFTQIVKLSLVCKKWYSLFEYNSYKYLKNITIKWNYRNTDVGISILINNPLLKNVVNLDLFGKNISDENVYALASNTKYLQELTLENSNISNVGLTTLAMYAKNLRTINLAHCNRITFIGIKTLLHHAKNLNNINVMDCEYIYAADFNRYFIHENKLQELDITKCISINIKSPKYGMFLDGNVHYFQK